MKKLKRNCQQGAINILLIAGLVLVVIAIPVTVGLVRQRQELRKQAAVSQDCPPLTVCLERPTPPLTTPGPHVKPECICPTYPENVSPGDQVSLIYKVKSYGEIIRQNDDGSYRIHTPEECLELEYCYLKPDGKIEIKDKGEVLLYRFNEIPPTWAEPIVIAKNCVDVDGDGQIGRSWVDYCEVEIMLTIGDVGGEFCFLFENDEGKCRCCHVFDPSIPTNTPTPTPTSAPAPPSCDSLDFLLLTQDARLVHPDQIIPYQIETNENTGRVDIYIRKLDPSEPWELSVGDAGRSGNLKIPVSFPPDGKRIELAVVAFNHDCNLMCGILHQTPGVLYQVPGCVNDTTNAIGSCTNVCRQRLQMVNAECDYCRTYDSDWQEIPDLSEVAKDQIVYLCTKGRPDIVGEPKTAAFRVTVNGIMGGWQEQNERHNGEFCKSYTFGNFGSYLIEAMVWYQGVDWQFWR